VHLEEHLDPLGRIQDVAAANAPHVAIEERDAVVADRRRVRVRRMHPVGEEKPLRKVRLQLVESLPEQVGAARPGLLVLIALHDVGGDVDRVDERDRRMRLPPLAVLAERKESVQDRVVLNIGRNASELIREARRVAGGDAGDGARLRLG
jgi:hypothetical protein